MFCRNGPGCDDPRQDTRRIETAQPVPIYWHGYLIGHLHPRPAGYIAVASSLTQIGMYNSRDAASRARLMSYLEREETA